MLTVLSILSRDISRSEMTGVGSGGPGFDSWHW
jgi:hypothetical protein